MAAPAAILAVKAAIAVATDKRGRTVIASVVAAVLLPFILVIVMLLSIMDGASSHNVSAVAQVFWEGAISSQVPEEYRKYIVDMQTSFASLEDLIADIDHVEDRELDIEWVKSVFYAMYFGSAQPSLLAQKEFVDCFVEYEEREDGDGDSYTAAIPITDLGTVYDQCAVIPREEAKPGDLVFFTKTYASSTPVSHVGLYIGGNQMLHCGDPIGYANIDSNYWRSHFYAFARLPAA